MLAARRPRRSAYEAWLDERDARLPLTRAELRSRSDELAERAVASGGGIEAVIEATRLRSRENVLRLIEPAILLRAFDNEAAAAAAEPERDRLRRLVPEHLSSWATNRPTIGNSFTARENAGLTCLFKPFFWGLSVMLALLAPLDQVDPRQGAGCERGAAGVSM